MAEKQQYKCTSCGTSYGSQERNFYTANNSIIYKSNDNRMTICKNCIETLYEDLFKQYPDEQLATYKLCEILNIPFYYKVYNGAATNTEKRGTKIYQNYITQLNSFGNKNNYGNYFAQGEKLDGECKKVEVTVSEGGNSEVLETTVLNEQDKEVKQDVIRLMGYDPFESYAESDQKFLYNELMPYLDEDTLDDAFKLSQILQLVNNNNQIRKIDLVINTMSAKVDSLLSNHGDIKSLTNIKNQIVQSTDKIAKENSISVKNRGDKKAGKSTLTYQMKQYRELGFEDAEENYFDQNKAYGMKATADISNKSILEQLQFDENDYTDMIKTQRQLIEELQSKFEDLEEENRKLHVILDNK